MYVVTVTDLLGCTIQDSIEIDQPLPYILSVAQTNIGCFGDSTGSIDISVQGGTSPYAYSWTNGMMTQNISNLLSGTYAVSYTHLRAHET